MRRMVSFKDCQCDDYLNHGLLVDALIIAYVKGVSRRNTHNVLKSICYTSKDYECDEWPKHMDRKLYNEQAVMITDHKCDCIFRICKL